MPAVHGVGAGEEAHRLAHQAPLGPKPPRLVQEVLQLRRNVAEPGGGAQGDAVRPEQVVHRGRLHRALLLLGRLHLGSRVDHRLGDELGHPAQAHRGPRGHA